MLFALMLIVNLAIAYGAYRRKSLNSGGAVAAFLMGSAIYAWGGLLMWVLLMSFFLSSSFLTSYTRRFKSYLSAEADEEKEGRSYIQVLANGGLGLLFSLLFRITGQQIYLLAFATAFAAANADTWASEIGVISSKPPVSIITLRPVARGLSGGVSLLGTVASFFGALFIALVFATGVTLQGTRPYDALVMSLFILLGGFAGSIIDSILGATVQAKFYSAIHEKVVEKANYFGEQTRHIAGLAFVDNHVVNISSGLFAALLVIRMWIMS